MSNPRIAALLVSLAASGCIPGLVSFTASPTSLGGAPKPAPSAPAPTASPSVAATPAKGARPDAKALVKPVEDAMNFLLTEYPTGENPGEWTSAKITALANACAKAVDDALAAGVDKFYQAVNEDGKTKFIDDAKSDVCNAVRKFADIDAQVATYEQQERERAKDAKERAERDAAEAAEEAADRAAIGKLIHGERLAFVIDNRDSLYGPGQRALTTPADLARTSVYFIAVKQQDLSWTLYRTEFRGDKLVSETHKGFWVEPGPDAYR